MKMIFTRCVLAVLLLGMTGPLLSQDLKINEIMASNSQTIGDVDRDSPDWIELYNDSDTAVDLTGFGLSDDPDNPFRWIFPAILMDAHAHLLIFASGKDRRFVISHWETLIDWGDSWRYHLGDSTILPEWNTFHLQRL